MSFSEIDIVSRRERLTAVCIVIGLVLVALGLLPIASFIGQPMPFFLPAVLAAAMLITLLTAYLLTTQWRMLQHSPYGILASGYFFVGMSLVGQTIFFPNLLNGATEDQAFSAIAWLSTFWHLAFPLFAILYAAIQGRWVPFGNNSVKAIAWSSFIGIFAIYALVRSETLPLLVQNGHYTELVYNGIGYSVFCINLVAATVTALRTGGRIRQDLWLSIVLVCFGIEAMLSMQGYTRYSIGWYAGRIYMLTGATTMLVVLIHSLIQGSQKLQEINSDLNRLAMTDALTGLANRRQFDQKLLVYQRVGRRDKIPLTLLLVDIDYFKQYNDQYGHPAGDKALQRIAHILSSQVYRPLDLAARVGGEEFALLLPDADATEGRMVAERLRQAVRNLKMSHEMGVDRKLSISIGGAVLVPNADLTPGELLAQADQALYSAKNAGRNATAFTTDLTLVHSQPA